MSSVGHERIYEVELENVIVAASDVIGPWVKPGQLLNVL
ncbi:MAG: hypothetical protein CM1200mP22_01380 [Dehalococcoidia bacterium]|nr:MAG: hypothetical protein CM1200mP22_01380 [Dehalococcoidia bacterium]